MNGTTFHATHGRHRAGSDVAADGPTGVGRFTPVLPRTVSLILLAFAAAVAAFAATLLVLFVAGIGPTGVPGVPVVLAGGVLLVAAPTLVWELGLAMLDASVDERR